MNALTAYVLLRCLGQPCQVRIGVGWNEKRQMYSHAWLESWGRILVGGSADGLAVLPLFGA